MRLTGVNPQYWVVWEYFTNALQSDKKLKDLIKLSDVMYLTFVGSYAYGLNTANSDYDLKGVLLPSQRDFELCKFRDETYQIEGTDITLYSFGAFLRLLKSSNATLLEMFYCDYVIYQTKQSLLFYKNSKLFENTQLILSNLSFIDKQLTRVSNMFNGVDSVKRFNLFRLLSRQYKDYNLSLFLEVSTLKGVYIAQAKAKRLPSVKEVILDTDCYITSQGLLALYKGKPILIELGDLKVNLHSIELESLTTLSSTFKKISDLYKEYLNTSGAFLNTRQRQGKLGKHIQHIYRLIFMLESYMSTGVLNINVSKHRDFLLQVKSFNTLEEFQTFYQTSNVIGYWQELLDDFSVKAKTYATQELKPKQLLKSERSDYIDTLIKEVTHSLKE